MPSSEIGEIRNKTEFYGTFWSHYGHTSSTFVLVACTGSCSRNDGWHLMGAYVEALPTFGEHGIQVYPTRLEAPTVAMVRRPGKFRAREVDPRFADANAALTAGPDNNLTIVDIDASGSYYRNMAEEMFGETAYVVETPSGGAHMGFRHNGERRTIRPFGKNVPIDILGGGTVVVPPSTRPAGNGKCAGEYRFNGDLSGALAALRTIPEGLPPEVYRTRPTPDLPSVGERNSKLFRQALSLAAQATSEESFIEGLLIRNERIPDPLPASEVQRIAASVWRYKVEGRLCVPGSRTGFLNLQEITALSTNTSALALLAYLRAHHSADHVFAVSPHGIADSGVLQLDHRTIRRARNFLIENRFLERVTTGGWISGKQKPHQFRLSRNGGQ